MQNKAIGLLFSASDGANFAWGRIPMGASDYAESRYTLDDITGADPAPNSGETNRPAAGTLSLERDKTKLIPYIKAAKAVKADLRFWASPSRQEVSICDAGQRLGDLEVQAVVGST